MALRPKTFSPGSPVRAWTQKLRSLNLDHLRDRQWQNMDVREDFEITALLRHGAPGAEIPVRHEIPPPKGFFELTLFVSAFQ